MEQFGLPEYDASILTGSKILADFFEEAATKSSNAKAVSNWIMGDFMKIIKERGLEIDTIPFPGENLAKMVAMIDKGTISGTIAKKVFEKMFDSKKDPETIVKEEGLEIVSDEGALISVVKSIIGKNPQSVIDYRSGKEKAFGFLVGQAMKETRGKANAQVINKILKDELENY